MPISGLVVTLSPEPSSCQAALDALHRHPMVEVGEGLPHRRPIVVETGNTEETGRFWEWLQALPGVLFVDVAYVHLEDSEGSL